MGDKSKKRNTLFVYEALAKEITKSIIFGLEDRKNVIVELVKENFAPKSELAKEFKIYQSVLKAKGMRKDLVQKLITELKKYYDKIDQEKLTKEKNRFVSQINKKVGKEVFSNFVKNYRTLSNIYRTFDTSLDFHQKLLAEDLLIEEISTIDEVNEVQPIDNIVYSKFVEGFNRKYHESPLLTEQKQLIFRYASSVGPKETEFKVYLSEEIGRLKSGLETFLKSATIEEDFKADVKKVYEMVCEATKTEITEKTIEDVLRIQNLVREFQNDQS